MNCTAQTLAANAKCFSCLTKKQIKAIKIALLCSWVSKVLGK